MPPVIWLFTNAGLQGFNPLVPGREGGRSAFGALARRFPAASTCGDRPPTPGVPTREQVAARPATPRGKKRRGVRPGGPLPHSPTTRRLQECADPSQDLLGRVVVPPCKATPRQQHRE